MHRSHKRRKNYLAVVLGGIVMPPAYPIYLKVSRKVRETVTPRILVLVDEIEKVQ